MLGDRRYLLRQLLSVAGSMAVITSVVFGADIGVLISGLHGSLPPPSGGARVRACCWPC